MFEFLPSVYVIFYPINNPNVRLFAECDKACNGCTGDGPDYCKSCATGYLLKDGVCTSEKLNQQQDSLEMSRYATYMGLCLATFIIFRNNVYIASVIGVIVATYIGIAEYTVKRSPLFHDLGHALDL